MLDEEEGESFSLGERGCQGRDTVSIKPEEGTRKGMMRTEDTHHRLGTIGPCMPT